MAVVTYVPFVRRACRCEAEVPQAYTEAVGRALVDVTQWRYLPHFVVAIPALLALLVVSLQVGSHEMFAVFWCLWSIVFLSLIVSNSKRPKQSSAPDIAAKGATTCAEEGFPRSTPGAATLPRLMGRTRTQSGKDMDLEDAAKADDDIVHGKVRSNCTIEEAVIAEDIVVCKANAQVVAL